MRGATADYRYANARWACPSGAFFFGATASVSAVLERIGANPKTFILDFADVRSWTPSDRAAMKRPNVDGGRESKLGPLR